MGWSQGSESGILYTQHKGEKKELLLEVSDILGVVSLCRVGF